MVTHITWCINDRVLITGDVGGNVFLSLLPPSPNPLLGTTEHDTSDEALAAVRPQSLMTLAAAEIDAASAHLGSPITSLQVRQRVALRPRGAPGTWYLAVDRRPSTLCSRAPVPAAVSSQCSPLDTSLWAVATANGKVTVWRTHVLLSATAKPGGANDELSLQVSRAD